MTCYNALIRTHHITSRKKVAALKRAAERLNCSALLRSGGCPGIMYVEARDKDAVESWVGAVRELRYKDFQLVSRPASMEGERDGGAGTAKTRGRRGGKENGRRDAGLEEVESVKEFGSLMEKKGVLGWWRRGMGYVQ
ncbi:uncharacterized protein DNG_08092 [Cephalotrichum gorgonifer]|uniref:Uncharacterized protein n=1 Tax=Cephalotrichum gorgonifer TaxID=2041049 RepID=A0AAE8N339_9PEZI|nr:uncharacterized protein DNG_08092 [Cephalotrichum gorgonifer]